MEVHIATATRLMRSTYLLNAHTALYLLMECLGPAKVLYTLKTSRLYQRTDMLQTFDKLMSGMLSDMAIIFIGDAACEQLSIPIALGGVGICRVEELTLPAFLA